MCAACLVCEWLECTGAQLTELLDVACARMGGRLSKLSREEIRLADYPETASDIDVCEGSQNAPVRDCESHSQVAQAKFTN